MSGYKGVDLLDLSAQRIEIFLVIGGTPFHIFLRYKIFNQIHVQGHGRSGVRRSGLGRWVHKEAPPPTNITISAKRGRG